MKQVIRKQIVEENKIDITPETYTLIIDGNSLLKLSLVDKRVNSRNEEYGAVLQFFWQIRKRLVEKDYNYVYVFWDGDGSGQLRYRYYPEYKANRGKNYRDEEPTTEYDRNMAEYCRRVIAYSKAKRAKQPKVRNETEEETFERQMLIIRNMLEHLFVRQLKCDDVEGDDLIAYYVNHKKKGEKITIFSGDRDITQLISDDVSIYIPQIKKTVTASNHKELIGYPHENVVLKKMICGDQSDNIKGIKGVGDKTFFTLFPEAKERMVTLDDIMNKSRLLLEERKSEKKKPLKSLENILNSVTDGCQGEMIYEINRKIIDLSHPLLTKEAEEEIESISYAPIDPEGRDYQELYKIIIENDMNELLDEKKFSLLFSCFEGLIKKEKKMFAESLV